MKTCTLWISLLMAVALLLPAGFALGQGRMAELESARRTLTQNPTFNNRLSLGTLEYLQGVDYLRAGNMPAALESLRASVRTLEEGGSMVPENHPVFEEARYGLGYALLRDNKASEAVRVLNQVVNAAPEFHKARYLLGVALLSMPGEPSMTRGVTVFTALAQEGEAPYNEMAQHAATRYGYNVSTLAHAQDDAAGATESLGAVTGVIGDDKGASAEENTKVRYAQGIYVLDTGDVFGGLDHLEAAYRLDRNSRLSNGVALSGVLSNTYFAAGLDQLQLGGETSNRVAIAMFEGSVTVGDANAADANHGLAVAYTRLGDAENALAALRKVFARDAAYYERVKAK